MGSQVELADDGVLPSLGSILELPAFLREDPAGDALACESGGEARVRG